MENRDYTPRMLPLIEIHRVMEDLRILVPFLTDQARACVAILQAELASQTRHCPPIQASPGYPLSIASSARSLVSPTFDRCSSGLGFSDTSSVTGSIHSTSVFENDTPVTNPLAPDPIQLQKGGCTPGYRPSSAHRVAKTTHRNTTPAASSPLTSFKKLSFECPFCAELKTPSSKSASFISRKADLKRHFKAFHHTNAQFLCPDRSCGMTFDWKSALENHMKDAHSSTRYDLETAMVKLCPQLVFACGFSNCRQIFEADNGEDAEKVATKYFIHVANHFDDNLAHRRWSYSVRLRNLTRQRDVELHWKDKKKGSATQGLNWQPHTSAVVRKMLETRHLSDINMLVEWTLLLGSTKPWCDPLSPMPKQMPAALCFPIERHCTSHGPAIQLASHTYAFQHEAPNARMLDMGYPAQTTSLSFYGFESQACTSNLGHSFLDLDEPPQVTSSNDVTLLPSQSVPNWFCHGFDSSSFVPQAPIGPAASYIHGDPVLSLASRPMTTPAQQLMRTGSSSPHLSAISVADTDMSDARDADHEPDVDYGY